MGPKSTDASDSTPERPSIAYATPGGGTSPTWRLATLVVGALGFTFLGGCFCIGLLYMVAILPRIWSTNGYPLPLTAGQTALAAGLAAMAILCFVAAISLILAAFRLDRATR